MDTHLWVPNNAMRLFGVILGHARQESRPATLLFASGLWFCLASDPLPCPLAAPQISHKRHTNPTLTPTLGRFNYFYFWLACNITGNSNNDTEGLIMNVLQTSNAARPETKQERNNKASNLIHSSPSLSRSPNPNPSPKCKPSLSPSPSLTLPHP